MKRSELETKYYKTKKEKDKTAYKKQNNYVSRLYKKEMKTFYQNLDIKDFLDNKKFWKNAKSLFSEKVINGQKITIVKGKQIICEDKEIA